MPSSNQAALARLLRQSDALEVQANRELQALNEQATNDLIAEAQAQLRFPDNSLEAIHQPVYATFDSLSWDLWQGATEPWPVGCVSVKLDTKIKYSSPHAAGKHSSRHVNRGKKAREVEIECTLWTNVHFAAYREVEKIYGRNLPIGKTGNAVRIFHPNTFAAGVAAILIKQVGSPVHEGKQLFKATIRALEYTPEPKRNAAGPSRAGIQLPPSQIDRLGQINRSVAPVTPRDTEGVPASGIPAPIASGL